MLNVIRSQIYGSAKSLQYDHHHEYAPSIKRVDEEGPCGCYTKRNKRIKKERERIKQFSIWFEETEVARQKEYIKRRRERRSKREKRDHALRNIRILLIPAFILLGTGTFLLLACYVHAVNLGSWFAENKTRFTIIGSLSLSVGFIIFFVQHGLASHYGHKKGVKVFMKIPRFQQSTSTKFKNNSSTNSFSVPLIPSHDFKDSRDFDKLDQNDIQNDPKKDAFEPFSQKQSHDISLLATENLPDRKVQKKKPPKLAEISARGKGYQVFKSVDSSASVLTDCTFVSCSTASTEIVDMPFAKSALGEQVLEESDNSESRVDFKAIVTTDEHSVLDTTLFKGN